MALVCSLVWTQGDRFEENTWQLFQLISTLASPGTDMHNLHVKTPKAASRRAPSLKQMNHLKWLLHTPVFLSCYIFVNFPYLPLVFYAFHCCFKFVLAVLVVLIPASTKYVLCTCFNTALVQCDSVHRILIFQFSCMSSSSTVFTIMVTWFHPQWTRFLSKTRMWAPGLYPFPNRFFGK